MTNRLFTLGLALTLLAAQAAPAEAQSAAPARGAAAGGDWSAVEAVTPGVKLDVRMKSGERVVGRLSSATDLILVIERGGRTESYPRDRIMSVARRRDKSRLAGALVGAGVGGGIGTGLGAYFYSLGDFYGATVPGMGVVGAGIGAGVGAALGKGRKSVVIYEAH